MGNESVPKSQSEIQVERSRQLILDYYQRPGEIAFSFVGLTYLILGTRLCIHPPASEASREVANLTERKNPHTPVYGVKDFVCPSVTNFDHNYLRTG